MKKQNTKQKISIYIFYFLSIIAIAYGLMYLFRDDIMSYHYAFLRMDKTQINDFNPHIIKLMLALMKISGACFVSVGVTAFIITGKLFRNGEKWALWCLISLFSLSLIPMFFVTLNIANNIPSEGIKPPWQLTLVMLILLIIAILLSCIKKTNRNN